MELNPKEVLMCLKDYGIISVSKEDFKKFMKDLKKLIKYEERRNENVLPRRENDNFELFSVRTSDLSVSAKNNSSSICIKRTECRKPDGNILRCRNILSQDDNNYLVASVSKIDGRYFPSKDTVDNVCKCNDRPLTSLSDAKTIRSTSCRKQRRLPKDPVGLYHYYQAIWKKHTLPGENNHIDLRREIRQRMMKKS